MQQGQSQREAFLDRIRDPLGRAKGQALSEPAPIVDASIARLVSADADILEVFVTNARASGMHVHRTQQAKLAAAVLDLLKAEGIKRMVVACAESSVVAPLRDLIGEAEIEMIDWRAPAAMDGQFDLDAGLSDVHAAIAETGTIICASDGDHSRGPSLVPPTHLAVVRRSDIVPDLLDYFASLEGECGRALPSSIALITGPSKTADIEGILITGVHGPGKVHVVVVEDA